jgi:hypothetical protein
MPKISYIAVGEKPLNIFVKTVFFNVTFRVQEPKQSLRIVEKKSQILAIFLLQHND